MTDDIIIVNRQHQCYFAWSAR